MFSKAIILALAASPLVAAHGKVAVVAGDAGGNGTALGILGGVVPGPGKNSVTEVDTTVFSKKQAGTNILSDGLGKTTKGANTAEKLTQAMAQSGNTLPQVTPGGTLSGTFHIVTSDGAGPIQAVVDPTGTGAFSKGTKLNVVTQIPGKNGNIRPGQAKRSYIGALWERGIWALEDRGLIAKRAVNINTDHQMAFTVPADTQCTGTVAGVQNVCLVKIANSNPAGPFGGVVAIQMAAGGAAAAPAAAAKKVARDFSS